MHTGWIKLYRCLLEDPLWQCCTPEQKVILVTLLLMANHAETKWQWQGRPYTCVPGQMITSLKSIRDKCGRGISLYNIRTAIRRFEKLGFLTNRSTNHNRLITICQWERYQMTDDAARTPTHNPPTRNAQTLHKRPAPNKNDKKDKNEKKSDPAAKIPLSFEEQDIQRAAAVNAEAMAAFLEAPDERDRN